MPWQRTLRIGLVGAAMLAGCTGRPAVDDSTTDSGTHGTGAETSTGRCEGAALEYHGVCFFAHSVDPFDHDHPLDLDGVPGDELVGVNDGKVSVHRWNGAGFDLVGESDLPQVVPSASVVAGEFDDTPGLDLIVAEGGEWAALYHVNGGAPAWVATTMMSEVSSDDGFESPVAVGPDDDGRWRVVAHFDNDAYAPMDPLALWTVQGGTLVDERIDLPTDACSFAGCVGGDFDADGRRDAVCTLMDSCSDPAPEQDTLHVVLLAQANGSVSATAYPTKDVDMSAIAVDLDADGRSDILGWTASWYRLTSSDGSLGPVVLVERPDKVDIGWNVVSLGDIDGDADMEILLGDGAHGLLFPDLVAQPDDTMTLEVADDLGFKYGTVRDPIDVNRDGVVDLPMRDRILLVSEIAP